MRRREFLALSSKAALATMLSPSVPEVAEATPSWLKAWDGPPPEETEPLRRALWTALLAPSSHNSQPWRIRFRDANSVELYADPSRKLTEVDPHNIQWFISQGTFLELFSMSALHHGLEPSFVWIQRNEEEYWNLYVDPIQSPYTTSPLYEQIPHRVTNKRVYQARVSIPVQERREIVALCDPFEAYHDIHFHWIDHPIPKLRIADFCREAMVIESSSPERNRELSDWFRLSGRERRLHRDGLELSQNGVTGISRWVAEYLFISHERMIDPEGQFQRRGIELTWEQATSASAWGLIEVGEMTPESLAQAGRLYVRLQLKATEYGISMHPMTQVLGTYPDMFDLREGFKWSMDISGHREPVLLFRMGYADPVRHTARRSLDELVIV